MITTDYLGLSLPQGTDNADVSVLVKAYQMLENGVKYAADESWTQLQTYNLGTGGESNGVKSFQATMDRSKVSAVRLMLRGLKFAKAASVNGYRYGSVNVDAGRTDGIGTWGNGSNGYTLLTCDANASYTGFIDIEWLFPQWGGATPKENASGFLITRNAIPWEGGSNAYEINEQSRGLYLYCSPLSGSAFPFVFTEAAAEGTIDLYVKYNNGGLNG